MKFKKKKKGSMGYFYSLSPGDPKLNAEIFNNNMDNGECLQGSPSGPISESQKKNEYLITYIDRDTDSVTKGFVKAYSVKQAGLVFRKQRKDVYKILSIECVEDHSKDDGEQINMFEGSRKQDEIKTEYENTSEIKLAPGSVAHHLEHNPEKVIMIDASCFGSNNKENSEFIHKALSFYGRTGIKPIIPGVEEVKFALYFKDTGSYKSINYDIALNLTRNIIY